MRATRLRHSFLVLLLAALLGVIGSAHAASAAPVIEDDVSSQDDLISLGAAYGLFAFLNDGDAEAARGLIASDAVISTHIGDYVGLAGALEYVSMVEATYPDYEFEITSISTGGDSTLIGWTLHATRMELDTFGRVIWVPFDITGVASITVVDGEITHLSAGSEGLALVRPSTDTASLPPQAGSAGLPF